MMRQKNKREDIRIGKKAQESQNLNRPLLLESIDGDTSSSGEDISNGNVKFETNRAWKKQA
jgi:hypothetical protein